VEVYRRLVEDDHVDFGPHLAGALNKLGIQLSDLERHEEALAVTTEAVEIYRQLAEANPTAFEPDLAYVLSIFAWVRAAGQIELQQALTAAEQSVTLYEGLAQQSQQAPFNDDLHGALSILADVLDELDRNDEATDIRRRISDRG
jgi:tetratricopeptide (TPR) repeat protein